MGDPLKSFSRTLVSRFVSVLFLLLICAVHNQASAGDLQKAGDSAPKGLSKASQHSVLERFRLYTGERSAEELMALFSTEESPVVRQQPRIAISDGSTAVILAIKLVPVDGSAPNFSLRNAELINLQQKNNSEWVLKVMPAKGAVDAVLVVAAGTGIREYPLTVAAPLPVAIKPGLQEFKDFLKSRAGECTKELDLNTDGVCDYKDDYIYTAHYIHSESLSGRSKDARRQRALQRTLSVPPPKPPRPASGVVTDPNFQP